MKDSSSVIQIPLLNQFSGLFAFKSLLRMGFAASIAGLLVACGGGGSGSGGNPLSSGSNNDAWQAGVYKDSERFENQCEKPRVGASKITGIPYPDRKGSLLLEKKLAALLEPGNLSLV